MKFCIVGAGFSGAVIGRCLADAGYTITIIDERDHVGGNSHTKRDPVTGVMIHVYGPHIFHTDNPEVWDFICSYCTMMPYINRVKAISNGRVFSMPINLHTINQFFGTTFSPQEARAFIAAKARADLHPPRNFEEQALYLLGEELYQAFFYGYTRKQWGVEPAALPAEILKRLPVRFTYNDNYFNHSYQGIPKEGYTAIIEKLLTHPNITCHLQTPYEQASLPTCDHIVYTGPIDRYFDYRFGRLGYRTLEFETFRDTGDFQGNAVMNFCDYHIPYTRITEHKHFAPWELDIHQKTICYREFSKECGSTDIPYYPLPIAKEKQRFSQYAELAREQHNVTFLGRMGTYRYLDMDVTIAEALRAGTTILRAIADQQPLPVFVLETAS